MMIPTGVFRAKAMKLILVLAFVLPFVVHPVTLASPIPRFNRVILISYDGANPTWVAELMRLGYLPNLASLMQRGAMNSLFIVDHDPSTDPGLSTIETGYGPDVHKIYANVFGATTKISIPAGLSIGERIKSFYGSSWKVAVAIPWATAPLPENVTRNVDPIFWNLANVTDYSLAAENLTWTPGDPEFDEYAFTPTGLINASYLVRRVVDEFIGPNSAGNFYVRIHMTEPDAVGHSVTVDKVVDPSSQYAYALELCDNAIGLLISGLERHGILDSTLILVTTDHGFLGGGHSGGPKPYSVEEVHTCFLVSSHSSVCSPTGLGLQNDIAPTILSAVGIEVDGLIPRFDATSGAMPLFMATEQIRETTPPEVVSVSFPDSITEGSRLNATIVLSDPSGISLVDAYYVAGSNLFKAQVTQRQGATLTFDMQTVRIWNVNSTQVYFEFFDNSSLKNKARYPASGFITVPVNVSQEPPTSTDYISPSSLLIAAGAVLVLLAAGGYWYLFRRPK